MWWNYKEKLKRVMMGLLSHVHWYLDLECKHCKQMNDRDDQQSLGIFILALSIRYLLG